MKKAREYTIGIPDYDKCKYDINSIIKQVQKDAIEAALKLAAENSVVDVIDHEERLAESIAPHDGKFLILPIYGVDEDSILSLKDELFKQIE